VRFCVFEDATAVAVPCPLFLQLSIVCIHVLADGEAHAGEVRIRFEESAAAKVEIIAGSFVLRSGADAMLVLGGGKEDVPGEDINPEATFVSIFHDLLPEGDLLIDTPIVDLDFFAVLVKTRDALDGDAGILVLHIEHRCKRMRIPQREHVVAMPRHFIEPRLPERHVPHVLNSEAIRCATTVIEVSWSLFVERHVELDASVLQVRSVVLVDLIGHAFELDVLGDL